jgi:hypothetical protein
MEKINVDELDAGDWVEDHGDKKVSVQPLREEIEKAIGEGNLEMREFQKDCEQITAEWNREAGNSFEEYCRLRRQYHARRIAYFVVHGWHNPIALHDDKHGIKDGLHRLKAAKHKGMKTICFRVG